MANSGERPVQRAGFVQANQPESVDAVSLPTAKQIATQWNKAIKEYRTEKDKTLGSILSSMHAETGTETPKSAAQDVAHTVFSIFHNTTDPKTEGKGREAGSKQALERAFERSFSLYASAPAEATRALGTAVNYLVARIETVSESRLKAAAKYVAQGTAFYGDHLLVGAASLDTIGKKFANTTLELIDRGGANARKIIQATLTDAHDLREVTEKSDAVRNSIWSQAESPDKVSLPVASAGAMASGSSGPRLARQFP